MEKVLEQQYQYYKNLNLNINMARGRPCPAQLDLSLPMFDLITSSSNLVIDGVDYRNYGVLDGIKPAKKMFSDILDIKEENILIYGNSSLNLMHDLIYKSVVNGVMNNTPWSKLDKIKFLCPVPGYDRHFAICELLNIEMVNISINEDGPDMDLIEQYIKDPTVKGIWCIPKYSNPTGTTYSDEVVKRFARLKPASKDFRIYWDTTYITQVSFSNQEDHLLNIFDECQKCHNEDLVYIIGSTSKMSFPGSGVSALGASIKNIEDMKQYLQYQTIGFDKINQLRHALFFKDKKTIKEHMKKHMEIMKPKFDLMLKIFDEEIKDLAIYNHPSGGYFISLFVPHKAKEVVNICCELGVTLTDVGSAYPYHHDPENSHIRIAPTYPDLKELEIAAHVISLAVKMVA